MSCQWDQKPYLLFNCGDAHGSNHKNTGVAQEFAGQDYTAPQPPQQKKAMT